MRVTRLTPGAISLIISNHFPINGKSMKVKPVRLPPGCDRLATRSCPTGSLTNIEYDRNGTGRLFQCGSDRRPASDDEVRCRTHQLSGVGSDSVHAFILPRARRDRPQAAAPPKPCHRGVDVCAKACCAHRARVERRGNLPTPRLRQSFWRDCNRRVLDGHSRDHKSCLRYQFYRPTFSTTDFLRPAQLAHCTGCISLAVGSRCRRTA
jgi:hypothetical protein